VAGGDRRVSFADALDAYLLAHAPRWGNEAHVLATFKRWCTAIMAKPVARVDEHDVQAILQDHWRRVPISAQRQRRRLERVLAFCMRKGWHSGPNPATLESARDLLNREPEHVVQPHKSLPWKDACVVYYKLTELDNVGALPLRFAILTACRTQEARDLRWTELDLPAKLWRLPPVPGRQKQHKRQETHEIPLSSVALELLAKVPRQEGQDLVFGPMGREALRQVLHRKLKLRGHVSVHGWRATFVSFCIDNKVTDSRVAEAALGHRIKHRVRAAYERTTQLQERARALEAWGQYLDGDIRWWETARPRRKHKVIRLGRSQEAA
jgi:integrase